jgi:hypothetical protein
MPSLTEAFKRQMAEREANAAAKTSAAGNFTGPSAGTGAGDGSAVTDGFAGVGSGIAAVAPDNSAEDADDAAEDDDMPVWSGLSKTFGEDAAAAKTAEQNGGAPVPGGAEPEPPPDPRMERVLRLFRGTIVK